jgi:exo-1,4-beta-D-glucosaminidase
VSRYANLKSLTGMPRSSISATASTSGDPQQATTTVTLRNTGTGTAPAFFVAATLRRADGKRVLPALWSDNYVTLWPGESTTLTVRYRTADAGGGSPSIDIAGVNTDRITLPAR